VFDVVPVLGLDAIEDLVVVIPVEVLILLFFTLSNILEIFERMAVQILIERNTLGQFLKNLIPSWHFAIAVNVERERWFERFWRDDLDASILLSILLREKVLDVVDGVFELFFGRPEYLHRVYHIQIFVHVLRLHQRVLDSLVQQFLLLFERGLCCQQLGSFTLLVLNLLLVGAGSLMLVDLLKPSWRLHFSSG
jgi:hypothetical protein